jgi:ABC-type Na+ efflux pump permease subunit
MVWVLLAALLMVTYGLSSGNLAISSGDSTIGGEARAYITSEFSIAMMFPLVTFMMYSFFVAVAAGMTILQDDELKVGPILHATRLRPKEYVWAKFTAVLGLFLVTLTVHLLLTMFFNQVMPNDNAELIRGPFLLSNYLRPAIFLALPFIIFLCGASFAIGEWTRRPILVFVTPVAFFLVSIFFLWDWSPSWLDPRINRLLMWIEPSGFRWINETWLKVDLGVEYYNHQPVGYDLPFLLSRLVYALLGIALVVLASRHFTATLRGRKDSKSPRWRLWRKTPEASVAAPAASTHVFEERSIAALKMRSGPPGFVRTTFDIARFEAKNLLSQPGLYIFVPLILLQTIGSTFFRVGPFETPLLLTPGSAAVGSMNTLTFLVAGLILFYTVESVSREWRTGLAPMFYASPTRMGAILLGKALANSLVGVTILLACYLGAAIVMLAEGKVAPVVGPFLLVWGLLLVPTFLVWSAFVTAMLAVTGNRFSTYGLGLAALAFTGWKQTQGEMNWVGNWNLWDAVTWTDFGALDPNSSALLLNRLFWLAVMVLLIALTVRLFPRREADSGRTLDRLRPLSVLKTAWQLTPVALPAIALGIVLWVQTTQGFQGGATERREEEYRGRNLVTWAEASTLQFTDVDLDLTLEPDEGSFAVEGRYEMINRSGGLLRRFPLSVGDHFEDLSWTLNGEPYEPENWARMLVFTPPKPLAPGDILSVGFKHHGRLPKGITKNGGGLDQFILPSGVVLTSFGSSFLPVPFFEADRGIDKDNRLEPRSYEEGFWEGLTRPGIASGGRFQVRTRITGPEQFSYHGVGVRESEEVKGGRRTVVWQTDHPVNFFNVVAGEWDVWEGEGVAVYHHRKHDYNVPEIGEALEAARKYYSEWFYPYPWQELKLSEFPGLATYAQGFPTNITFSENIGFLTRSTPEAQVAFLVTAHEAAHQWWGNILLPGEGPGGNILSEGMAHFSTLLLAEQVKGLRGRIEFAKRIEERYGDRRRVDAERPLVWTDGSKAGDTTVTYDKGGWVFWMLTTHLGREVALAGIQDFIGRYVESNDYPVLQDFIAVMREHAVDQEAFDAFVGQWFLDVVMPQYRFESAEVKASGDGFTVSATVKNVGTGRMPVEVAAVRGERFLEEPESTGGEDWRDARVTVTLGAGESATVTIPCGFEPERLLIDPDVRVLMLLREQAEYKVAG